MHIMELRRAYDDFLAEVDAGGFGPPPPGEWSAEQIVAHVAVNDSLLCAATEAVLGGHSRPYYNHDSIDEEQLNAVIKDYPDLASLTVLVRAGGQRLCQLAERLDADRAVTPVHTHIRDGAVVRVDQLLPWARVIGLHRRLHLPAHANQLRALR